MKTFDSYDKLGLVKFSENLENYLEIESKKIGDVVS